jgi:hypothetical protein
MKRLTIEQENPVAQGNYDDTFRDDPDMTVKCSHCGAIWERYIVTPDGSLFDWNTSDAKHAYSTHEYGHTPVCKDFCYACALERAKPEDFKDFVVDSRNADDFREWMVGL